MRKTKNHPIDTHIYIWYNFQRGRFGAWSILYRKRAKEM